MTQNLAFSSKQYLHQAVSLWAQKYLKQKGIDFGAWHNYSSKTFNLSLEEQRKFFEVRAKHDLEAYEQCRASELIPRSRGGCALQVHVPPGLSNSHHTIIVNFPEPLPILFNNEHNVYALNQMQRDFPEFRDALPPGIVDHLDLLLTLNDALTDLMACVNTYTRARQLLDQLPTFLRFMPESIRVEMKVTNIRRRMRKDTKLLKPETVQFFAIMNLIQPMDE